MPRKAKVKRRTLDRRRTNSRKKKVEESEDEYSDSSNNHESSEEESSESEVDQEESSASDDYQPSSTDDDEEEEELEADDEDFVVKKPKKKKRQTIKRRMQVAPKRSSLETIGESNDSDSSVPQPIKKRSSVARRVIDDDDDSQSSDSRRQSPRKMTGSTSKRRSPRKMTASTSKRLAEMSDDDEKMPMIPKKKSASDEEYVESGQDDDDDTNNDDESDFDEESGSEEENNPNNAVNIDNDDIFSAEESADEEDEVIYVKPPPKRKQNTRTRAVDIDNDQIASPEDSSSEEEEQPRRRRNIREIRPSQGLTSSSDDDSDEEIARCPICPSTDDAITMERLPEKHVCFISPDGTSRQCFALETLRKIALTSTFFRARVDLDGATRQNFLQPPHFRSPMSDDMLDQIASRFGRDALNIHGDYYKRNRSTPGGSFSDVEDMFSETYRADETSFQDQVRDYVKRQMGSQDVYTCPLCYTEMHKRMVKKDFDPRSSINQPSRESGDEESDIDKYPPDSVYDPMLVLEYLDNGFEAASFFCFKRVAQLKKHLREDHGVSTNQIQGNELYKRYSIRSPDGLLQRWLSGDHRRYAPSQGSMSTYWSSGNNFNFVLLLYKMNIAEQYRDLVDSTTDEEEQERIENYMAVAFDYFESFQDHALASWAQLSRPFEKGNDDDIRDFLDDDNDVEDDVETPHFAMRRQFEMNDSDSAQNAFVHDLERKYGGSGASDDDDSSSSQSSSDDDDDDEGKKGNKEANTEINTLNGYYSDVQEETDPWMLQKLSARKSLGSGRRKERPTTTIDLTNLPDSTTGKKLFQTPSSKKKKQTLVTNSTAKKPALSRTSSSMKRKRPVLEDSSSSDDDDSVLVIE